MLNTNLSVRTINLLNSIGILTIEDVRNLDSRNKIKSTIEKILYHQSHEAKRKMLVELLTFNNIK